MKTKAFFAILATSVALGGFGIAAHAETDDDMSFSGMFKVDRIDGNKDGMVSKAEFLAMMGKVWDMKAKEMKVKSDKMSPEEFRKFANFFPRGERN